MFYLRDQPDTLAETCSWSFLTDKSCLWTEYIIFAVRLRDNTILFTVILRNRDIQGVTGGMCETSGECSLGQTIPKNPKTPISKVERLRR